MAINKKLHEGFSNFFEQPTRQHLRELLESNIGETDALDFKKIWPTKFKLAKHVLAFSNSGGGVLVIGVAENDGKLDSIGLTSLDDKADIDKSLSPYLPNGIKYEVFDFNYPTPDYPTLVGKSFQVMVIEHDPNRIPYLCKKSGGEGLKDNAVYIRRGTSTTEADHEEVQKLINERIETGFSTSNVLELEEHLEQLKTLYSYTQKYNGLKLASTLSKVFSELFTEKSALAKEENPFYPEESYAEFIAIMINKKKLKIQDTLEVA